MCPCTPRHLQFSMACTRYLAAHRSIVVKRMLGNSLRILPTAFGDCPGTWSPTCCSAVGGASDDCRAPVTQIYRYVLRPQFAQFLFIKTSVSLVVRGVLGGAKNQPPHAGDVPLMVHPMPVSHAHRSRRPDCGGFRFCIAGADPGGRVCRWEAAGRDRAQCPTAAEAHHR